MPDRILRQDILTSDRVNRLSDSAEKFYRRLMSVADDFGRFDGRPSIILASCYQLQLKRVKESDIKKWMLECAKEEALIIYEVDNKQYVEIQNFKQRLRIMKSKYPAPSSADIRGHMTADREHVSDTGQSETKRNEVESEYESEEKRNEVLAAALPGDTSNSKKRNLPDRSEVRQFFLTTMGNTQNPGSWPADKCQMEADTCFDHYKANGWVQGRGKPIKDWKAACRNWIRNALKGNFSSDNGNKSAQKEINRGKMESNIPKTNISFQELDKIASEINFHFGRFREDPESFTVITADVIHYNYLKTAGKVEFAPEMVKQIREMAEKQLAEKKLPVSDHYVIPLMKKIGVIEFFKSLKETGAEAVFHGKN